MTKMNKVKSFALMAAVAAVVLSLTAGTASANVYTKSNIERCVNDTGQCVLLQAYSTYSSSQVWINGKVYCAPEHGSAVITWCGLGGANGTVYLNIGVNWDWPNLQKAGLYERMNIWADAGGCNTWGSNGEGLSWYNAGGGPTCEQPA